MALLDGLGINFGAYSGIIWFVIIGCLVLLVGGIVVGLVFFKVYQKRKWYLNTEFKMIRSDGKAVIGEWGKGYYDVAKGILWVKRKKKKKEAIKAQDMRLYLQGDNTITVEGTPGNWKPVIVDSFLDVIDDETRQEASVMKIRVDMNEDKQWAVEQERAGKSAFSVASFLDMFWRPIELAIIIFVIIISQTVVYFMLKP